MAHTSLVSRRCVFLLCADSFMAKKGKQAAMLDDPQQLYVFTCIVNKTEHIYVLNVRLQGYQRMTQQL